MFAGAQIQVAVLAQLLIKETGITNYTFITFNIVYIYFNNVSPE